MYRRTDQSKKVERYRYTDKEILELAQTCLLCGVELNSNFKDRIKKIQVERGIKFTKDGYARTPDMEIRKKTSKNKNGFKDFVDSKNKELNNQLSGIDIYVLSAREYKLGFAHWSLAKGREICCDCGAKIAEGNVTLSSVWQTESESMSRVYRCEFCGDKAIKKIQPHYSSSDELDEQVSEFRTTLSSLDAKDDRYDSLVDEHNILGW